MSFYGNMSNAGKTEISFDKVYSNRAQMDKFAANDGVFVGRRVLVEYDDNTKPRRRGYIKDTPSESGETICLVYSDSAYAFPFVLTQNTDTTYGLQAGDIVYAERFQSVYYFQATGDVDENGKALFEYVLRSSEVTTDPNESAVTDYILNYAQDKKYADEVGLEFTNGWDATVWEKRYSNGVEHYSLIANLNSIMPKMFIQAEAPSILPKPPHFAENSTNMSYTLHMPTPWGFQMQEAETFDPQDGTEPIVLCDVPEISLDPNANSTSTPEGKLYKPAVYYNKAGFSSKNISHSSVPTEFRISPTGKSTVRYLTHGGDTPVEQIDMQELKIHLPDIGNMMSEVWDVVYGDKTLNQGLTRNRDIEWANKTGLRLVNTREDSGEQTFNTENMATIAGCINSVQDIMGTNIVELSSYAPPERAGGSEDTIYYGPLGENGKIGFFYKDTEYVYSSFEEKELNPNDYVGEKQYVDLVQFEADKYYYYEGLNFYLERNVYPEDHTSYYLLDEPIEEPNLLSWPPLDKDGKEQYPFYKVAVDDLDIDGDATPDVYFYDYYQDVGETPKDNVVHYNVTATQATHPLTTQDSDGNFILTTGSGAKLIWHPIDQVDLTEKEEKDLVKTSASEISQNKITGFKKGFFVLGFDEEEETFVLTALNAQADYDKDATYYYFPAYALAAGSTLEGQSVQTTFFLDDQFLISFAALCNEEIYAELLSAYQVEFLPYEPGLYYTKEIDKENKDAIIYHVLTQESAIETSAIYYTIEDTAIAGESTIGSPQFYTPYKYFTKTAEEKPNYLLSISKEKKENTKYYHLTQLEEDGTIRQLILDPETHLVDAVPVNSRFYIPGKYYYWSKSLVDHVLDQSLLMKLPVEDKESVDYFITEENKIYYLVNYAYVVKDENGVLGVGSLWDKSILKENGTWELVSPPSGITLGIREEQDKWTELRGFAKRRNTIHGRLMDINLLFRFDDNYVRDNASVMGCLHKMRDIARSYGKLNPGTIPSIDEYGRIVGATLNGPKLTDYSTTTASGELTDTDTLLEALRKLETRVKELEQQLATAEN